jgi:hypothetical protein
MPHIFAGKRLEDFQVFESTEQAKWRIALKSSENDGFKKAAKNAKNYINRITTLGPMLWSLILTIFDAFRQKCAFSIKNELDDPILVYLNY